MTKGARVRGLSIRFTLKRTTHTHPHTHWQLRAWRGMRALLFRNWTRTPSHTSTTPLIYSGAATQRTLCPTNAHNYSSHTHAYTAVHTVELTFALSLLLLLMRNFNHLTDAFECVQCALLSFLSFPYRAFCVDALRRDGVRVFSACHLYFVL